MPVTTRKAMVQLVSRGRSNGRFGGTDMYPSWAKAMQKRHARQVRQQGKDEIAQALYEIDMEEVWGEEEMRAKMGQMAEKKAEEIQKILDQAIAAFHALRKQAYDVLDNLPRDVREEIYERHLVCFPYLDY